MKLSSILIALTLGVTSTAYAQSWDEIASDNRYVLQPLRSTWEELPIAQRQQWLSRTPKLKAMDAEQLARAHERMAEWASLSQKQRQQVQQQLNNSSNNANTRAQSWNSFISR
ncbi:MAG: DUF3106 domain-containing protein [Formosimonas sp.]